MGTGPASAMSDPRLAPSGRTLPIAISKVTTVHVLNPLSGEFKTRTAPAAGAAAGEGHFDRFASVVQDWEDDPPKLKDSIGLILSAQCHTAQITEVMHEAAHIEFVPPMPAVTVSPNRSPAGNLSGPSSV